MKLNKILGATEAGIHWVIEKSILFTSGILFLMMMLVAVDVIGRYFFNHAIKGGMEYTEILMVFLVSLTLGYSTFKKKHIVVDIIYSRFSGSTKEVFETLWSFIAAVISTLITWQIISWGLNEMISPAGRLTLLLEIPEAPFILVAGLGFLLMGLESWIAFFHLLERLIKRSAQVK